MSVPDNLLKRVDMFVETNDWGYMTRSAVITQAIREFLERHQDAPSEQALRESKTESAKRQ